VYQKRPPLFWQSIKAWTPSKLKTNLQKLLLSCLSLHSEKKQEERGVEIGERREYINREERSKFALPISDHAIIER
jgi:hypothetical protein